MIKFNQVKYISNNNYVKNDIELINLSGLKNKKEYEKTLINIDCLEKKYKLKKLEIVKLYYANRSSIHKIIYNLDKIIRLNYNNEIEERNLAYYFYLLLLIRDDDTTINYSYSIEYIKKLKESLIIGNKDKYYDLIISKIINDLINNYKGLDECEYNNKELEKIENENNERINDITKELEINYEDFKNKKIDEIYSNIILSLIKKNKFEDYDFTYNIIKQLDLESIDITYKIFEDIENILNKDENIKKRYQISNIEDLYDDKKLNFYYILLKYILKNSLYIYSIDYLSQKKHIILKIINSNQSSFVKFKSENMNRKIELNKFLELILGSKYYYNFIKENNYKNKINMNTEDASTDIKNKTTNINESSNVIITNITYNIKKDSGRYQSISSGGIQKIEEEKKTLDENYKIYRNFGLMEFKKIIGTHKFSLNGEEAEKISKATADFIEEIKNIYISGDINNSLLYYNSSFEISKEIKADWINNIFFCSKKNEATTKILLCTRENVSLFDEKGQLTKRFSREKIKNMTMIYLLGAIDSSKDNNIYFCISEDKFVLLQDLLSEIIQIKDYELIKGKSMKSIFQINENIFVIKSNKVISKGKDELIFFNNSSKKEIEVKIKTSYSFSYTTNGFSIMSIKQNKNEVEVENKALLCACKKYIKSQKNGILLVNMEINEDSDVLLSKNFYYTGSFEVYCFCPLNSFNRKVLFDQSYFSATDYFLVGGLDTRKCRGMIKLYKINFGKVYYQNTIEFIEDIIIRKYDKKNKNDEIGYEYVINGAISCIIQSSQNGEILASSWDGNVYLLENINLDYYLNYNNKKLYKELSNQ